MENKMVLRYAPSPTGPQHIGGLRTALYCYLLAQKHDAEFILRIEDTDQSRYVEGAEQFVIDACAWLGLEFTQGVHVGGPHAPYRQSERSTLYKKYAQQLLDAGAAYVAFDTPEELVAMRKRLEDAGVDNRTYNYVTRMSMTNSLTLPPEEVERRLAAEETHVIRFKVPEKADIRFEDAVRGWVHFHGSALDDKVLMKGDGLPTYHLANVVDDYLMEVTHVIRGEEWLPSTPLHVLLYRALGWQDRIPKFAHLALLLAPSGGKLSKRNADKYGIPVFPFDWLDKVSGNVWPGYKNLGYLPEALMNYIAFLGWNPGGEQEFFSKTELIAAFSLDRAHHAGAKFDMAKLNSFQQHYLRALPAEMLAEMAGPHLEKAGLPVPEGNYLPKVMDLMRDRITFAQDVVADASFFFVAPTSYDAKMAKKNWKTANTDLLREFRPLLAAWEDWAAVPIHDMFMDFLQKKELGVGKLMAPFRLALTGVSRGPGAFDIAELLGQRETLNRIDAALANFPAVDQA